MVRKQTYPVVATLAEAKAGLRGINRGMRLFLIPAGDGFSCLGFDVAHRKTADVAAWLGRADLAPPTRRGTLKAWKAYRAAMAAGAAYNRATGARCDADLIPALRRYEGRRVEVVTPSGERSRFIVGKSTGWLPCHLEIARRDSTGGGAAYVPDGSTVREV